MSHSGRNVLSSTADTLSLNSNKLLFPAKHQNFLRETCVCDTIFSFSEKMKQIWQLICHLIVAVHKCNFFFKLMTTTDQRYIVNLHIKRLARFPAFINQGSSIDNLTDFSQLRTCPTYCKSVMAMFGAPVWNQHHLNVWFNVSDSTQSIKKKSPLRIWLQMHHFPLQKFTALVPTVLSLSFYIHLWFSLFILFLLLLPNIQTYTNKTNNLNVDTKLR